jgi:hypothetical protein
VQEATGDSVDIAFVDQGYTGTKPATEFFRDQARLRVSQFLSPHHR